VIGVVLSVWGFVDVYRRGAINPRDLGRHMTDFTVYTEAGAAFFDGREPYAVTNPRGWGYLYLPLFAMLLAPLHALSGQWQVMVWFFISLATLAGCYFECVRMMRLSIRRTDLSTGAPGRTTGSAGAGPMFPAWMIGAAVGASAIPTLNCLQRGQIGVLQLYLLLFGVRLAVEAGSRLRGIFVAGLVLATPIGLKLTPVLPVACFWLLRLMQGCAAPMAATNGQRLGDPLSGGDTVSRGRKTFELRRLAPACVGASGTLCGLILYVFVVPVLMVGWQANLDNVGQWWKLIATKSDKQTYDRFAGDSYSVRNQSLSNALHHLGNWTAYQFAGGPYDEPFENEKTFVPEFVTDTRAFEFFIRSAQFGVLAVAAWLSWRGGRTHDCAWSLAAFGLACVAMLIASPIARAHYFVSLLPAVLFVPAVVARAGRPRAALWLAWSPVALILVHYAMMSIVGRVGFLGIGITIWFLCSAALLSRAVAAVAPRTASPPRMRRTKRRTPACERARGPATVG
jgi:hypothetical protein